jgi:cyclopropane fatty-acyl-phospholipid synthase-like methyltransferase
MKLQLLTLFAVSGTALVPVILAAAVMPCQDPPPAHDHHPADHNSSSGSGVDVHRSGMKHDFSDVEKHAKSFDGAERAAWQKPDHVIASMAIAPGMTVVDLGAGTGFFEPSLARAVGPGGKVLALDVEPKMVEHLRARAANEKLTQVEARLVASDDPGLAPGSVDRILIVNTWHHIDDRGAYSAKLRDALRSGGAIYVVDFEKNSAKGPPANHKLEPREVIAELEAGGLEASQIDEELSEQYVVVARARP